MKKLNIMLTLVLLSSSAAVFAQNASLDDLLRKTRQSATQTTAENERREQEFRSNRDRQRQLLAQARAELQAQDLRSEQLKAEYDENEKALAEMETVLTERSGNLGEMSGVVKAVASDLRGKLDGSLTSAEHSSERQKFLRELAQRKQLPTIMELKRLWYIMQHELTEQGKITSFTADVLRPSGTVDSAQSITRVGVFNAMSDGKFLQWKEPSVDYPSGILTELPRQPSARFTGLVDPYLNAPAGTLEPLPMDFTGGVILSNVVQSKTWPERLGIGDGVLSDTGDAGPIGYVIIGIGLLGLLLAAWRMLALFTKGAAIKSQLKKSTASDKNALGRVMKVYSDNPDADIETLELKLDEAILRETPQFERGLSFLKMLYVVAPLLGLLGTVVGMIATFQAITLFGTGNPKMMAGGISQALVTTVLGLVVAIPLTLIHSLLQSRSNSLIHILEEQSAGIIARMAEKNDGVVV